MASMGEIKITFDADARTRLRKLTTAINDLTRAINNSNSPTPDTPTGGIRLVEPERGTRTILSLVEDEYEEDLTVYCDCC